MIPEAINRNKIGVESEISFYRKQFGIDFQGLLEGTEASKSGLPFYEMITKELSTQGKEILQKIDQRLKQFTNKLPIIGNIQKVFTTSKTLTDALENMSQAAQDIHFTFSEGLATEIINT